MTQDSILHVVQIVNPTQCHCDSLHNSMCNLVASSNATNSFDVESTLIICVTVLLVVLLTMGVLVYSSNKQDVSNLRNCIKQLEEQIKKKADK